MEEVTCPDCQCQAIRWGFTRTRKQRWRCLSCKCCFTPDAELIQPKYERQPGEGASTARVRALRQRRWDAQQQELAEQIRRHLEQQGDGESRDKSHDSESQ